MTDSACTDGFVAVVIAMTAPAAPLCSLSGNCIGASGCIKLAEALAVNPSESLQWLE